MAITYEYFRNHCGHSDEKTIQPYLSVLTTIILYAWECASKEEAFGNREEISEKHFMVQANLKVTFQP